VDMRHYLEHDPGWVVEGEAGRESRGAVLVELNQVTDAGAVEAVGHGAGSQGQIFQKVQNRF
jgi:hypothetical protein